MAFHPPLSVLAADRFSPGEALFAENTIEAAAGEASRWGNPGFQPALTNI